MLFLTYIYNLTHSVRLSNFIYKPLTVNDFAKDSELNKGIKISCI